MFLIEIHEISSKEQSRSNDMKNTETPGFSSVMPPWIAGIQVRRGVRTHPCRGVLLNAPATSIVVLDTRGPLALLSLDESTAERSPFADKRSR
jgi:hypothetical protein